MDGAASPEVGERRRQEERGGSGEEIGREARGAPAKGRGRDAGYPAPPAQIRAGAPNAHGSYLGYLAANRSFGHGGRTSTGGINTPSRSRKRVHVHRCFWLRRRIWRNHNRSTSLRNPFIRSWLSGTA